MAACSVLPLLAHRSRGIFLLLLSSQSALASIAILVSSIATVSLVHGGCCATFYRCTPLSSPRVPFDVECSPWLASFVEFLASRCFEAISVFRDALLPFKPSEHSAFVLRALAGSTRGLSKQGHAFEACQHVLRIMNSMTSGHEQAHLRKLVDLVDFRGSDVRLTPVRC